MNIITSLDYILYIILAINVAYLFFFSVASLFHPKALPTPSQPRRKRIACLIPAYKEDAVIEECVHSCIAQDYPTELFDIIVISDSMDEPTNKRLSQEPIILHRVFFANSTKAKALNSAMQFIGSNYDIAIILDADNTIPVHYMSTINNAFNDPSTQLIQTHRTAKNKNNNMAYLDAISEETNNSIFRKGHINVGLSSALIGSGMAFDYTLLKTQLAEIDAVGGFDRALEFRLLREGFKINYLNDLYVYDEKVQNHKNFSNQRRRWMSAQVHYLSKYYLDFPKQLFRGNIDFCDKLFQHILLPRVILLGLTIMSYILSWIFFPQFHLKWGILVATLFFSMAIAIPKKLYTRQMLTSILLLPKVFYTMFITMFKLKNANKKFIHTQHGIK